MKKLIATGAFILSSLVSLNAMAASEEEMQQKAVADRQAVFKLLSASMAPLAGMARGGEFDLDTAVLATERIELLAGMIPELFATDTSGSGIATRAADGIWSSSDDFASMAADLAAAANAAGATLKSEGASAISGIPRSVGPKCGACHDAYRLD